MKTYLLGIDIGTTTSKAVLITGDGHMLAQTGVEHSVSRPHADWAEHDAEQVWWRDVVLLCHTLLERTGVDPAHILAMSVSGLYPVIVPVDAEGVPLRPAILYGIDQRARAEIADLERDIGTEYSIAVSGNTFTSQSIAPKILWLKHNEPEVFAKTARFLYATGYVNYKLTGRYVNDHGSASLSGLPYDMVHCKWDERTCAQIGITTDMLSELAWSGQSLGHVTAQAARETGLSTGTQVIVGTSDHAAETLALGGSVLGQGVISYGTTFGFDVCTDHACYIPGLTVCSSGFPERFLVGGAMATGAALTKWYCEQFGQEEVRLEQAGGENAYQQFSAQAAKTPPGAEGLISLPYFAGERCPFYDPDAVGMLYGLTLRHTRGHVYRALLEGVAYGVRQIKETIENQAITCSQVVAVGGGARSDVWCQILSDVTGLCQQILRSTNGSCLGDTMIAGLGAGLYKDLGACRGWNETVGTVEPRGKYTLRYEQYYRLYLDLYQATKRFEARL